jgi:hypothetical protein
VYILNFEKFWECGLKLLKKKYLATMPDHYYIENWTVEHGHGLNNRFPLNKVLGDEFVIGTIESGDDINLPISDLQYIYEHWDSYLGGKISREDLGKTSRTSTYCISIIKFLKDSGCDS